MHLHFCYTRARLVAKKPQFNTGPVGDKQHAAHPKRNGKGIHSFLCFGLTRCAWTCGSSQEETGAARSSQEEPGGARISQEQPGGAGSSQELGAARSSQ